MQATELLVATRKLLADKGITSGTCARNAAGTPVEVTASTVSCLCSYGGLLRAANEGGMLARDGIYDVADEGDPAFVLAERRLDRAARRIAGDKGGSYIGANDYLVELGRPEKVLEMFDLAIEDRAA